MKSRSQFLAIFCLTLFTLLSGCESQDPESKAPEIQQLFLAEPKSDAKKAIEQKDYRFIAVMNHHLTPPLNIDQCLVDKFGFRVISNESLDYMSYDFQMFGAMSVIYANWYNYEILSKLEELEEYPCPAINE